MYALNQFLNITSTPSPTLKDKNSDIKNTKKQNKTQITPKKKTKQKFNKNKRKIFVLLFMYQIKNQN